MGSTHVVVGHLFAKGVTSPTYFFGWGFTWVPWFFMLSGFVLFSAYLKNPKEETMIQYVLRRSTTIYPLYAFSLIPAFILGKAYGTMAAEWPTLLAQSFLLQAWVPHFTENALQMHCWFLSCMVVYWFFFKPLSHLLKNITLLKTCLLMGFFFCLPWLLILIPLIAGEDVDWYKNHQFYQTDDFLDIGVIVLKYHPICYFHVFILGMLLAKLRQLLDKKATASPHGCFSWRNPYVVALQFVAPLGYLALLLVFSVQEFQAKAWGYKLSARVSVLLPFQAMILFGLAGLPSLPLPYFSYMFSKMDFLENYSYCVYVFQFLCYAIWPQTGLVNLFWYIIYTYATAFLLARLIQQPIQKWWAAHTKARLVVPFVLGTFLVGFSFLPDPAYDNSLPDLPASIMIDNRTVDVRLNLEDPEGRLRGAMVINPSFLIQDGQILVAARRHRRETLQRNGIYHGPEGSGDAVIIDQIWHSEILLGSKAPAGGEGDGKENTPKTTVSQDMSMSAWSGLRTPQGKEWTEWLCVVETWIPSNSTVIRHIVTGPFRMVTLAFDSKPPHGGPSRFCASEIYIKAYYPEIYSCLTHPDPDCVIQAMNPRAEEVEASRTRSRRRLDVRMYMAQGVNIEEPGNPMVGYRPLDAHGGLTYGQTDVAEKNWIPFTYKDSVYFIYTPSPHVIVSTQMDGTSEKVYSTTFRPLQRITQESPHVQIRGSAQAVFVNNSQATPSLARPHYLALLHLYDVSTGRYAHHAYRFGAEPPFMMLQMSSALPLTEAASRPGGTPFAFASGLAVQGNTVVISYGAGDRDARALVMTLDKLDATWPPKRPDGRGERR
ncbi:Protein FAM3B [Durusdinium trenchii]|uniref:Protein FAM3B n=1 Tax=Durusdinium trenchii TaxID=1381693 RepID=A0ABP0MSW9_9DINO